MAKQITLESIVVRTEDLVASEVDGELVMMSIANGRYYGLDAIGTRVWARIKSPRAVSALCAELQNEYEVTAEQCRSDVLAFLKEMTAEDLVRVVDGQAG
jgi:hypothetical protein